MALNPAIAAEMGLPIVHQFDTFTSHMYGLLSGSFIPRGPIRKLRSNMRQREKILQDRSRYVQRMQKAMVQMNLMLVNVLDDITWKNSISMFLS